MSRKQLAEEKWMFRCIGALTAKENHKVLRKAFREAARAIREDSASTYESMTYPQDRNPKIAAAIRLKGKK